MQLLTDIEGCYLLSRPYFNDERGVFKEFYNETRQSYPCAQVSFSNSRKNVVRGIHRSSYSKLVSCLHGRLLDYVIDLRPESPTYLNHVVVELSPASELQLYVPAYCGHLFVSLEENTQMLYIQSGTYDPATEKEYRYNDPKFGLTFPISEEEMIISEKDRRTPLMD